MFVHEAVLQGYPHVNDAVPASVPHFFGLAVQHLQSIDDGTPPQMVRLHSHFALTFLQLGLERELRPVSAPVLTVVRTDEW